MKKLLSLFLLISTTLHAQMTVRGNIAATTPSLVLDFTKGTMPAGLTFSRNSTATRTNAQGLIEQVAANTPRIDYDATGAVGQNLLANSENLTSSTWEKYSVTLASSSTVTSPQGLTVAKVTETATTGAHWINFTYATSAIITYSIHARAAERSWLWAYFGGYTSGSAWFDLSAGTVGNTEPGVTATIEPLGNGWYRCSITKKNATASSSCAANLTTGNGTTSYAGDGSSGMYLWGVQINDGTVATTYTKTTTTPITTATAPVCRGLLMEEPRTNYVRYSNTPTTWSKGANNIIYGNTKAPDGSTVPVHGNVAGQGANVVHPTFPLTAGQTYTRSMYVKCMSTTNANNKIWVFESGYGGPGYAVSTFNLATGAAYSNDANSTNSKMTYVGDGWYRVQHTFTAVGSSAGAGQNYMGAYGGSVDQVAFAFWGGQVEPGTFATSLVPTTTATATREMDACSKENLGFAPATGSLIAEYSRIQNVKFSQVVEANNIPEGVYGTMQPIRINIAGGPTQDPRIQLAATSAGAVVVESGGTFAAVPVNTVVKTFLGYQSGDSVMGRNGAINASTTATFTNAPDAYKYITIGGTRNGQYGPFDQSVLNGHVRKLTYYLRRLPNQFLQSLTQ